MQVWIRTPEILTPEGMVAGQIGIIVMLTTLCMIRDYQWMINVTTITGRNDLVRKIDSSLRFRNLTVDPFHFWCWVGYAPGEVESHSNLRIIDDKNTIRIMSTFSSGMTVKSTLIGKVQNKTLILHL